ncbi:hypothetical protein MWH28_06980 [Natroniella sulfidigena]|uniref:hypothetical protein n=1 Tax=Natroniella sulfidigena TaxID=723921 RepID=UPI00200A3E7F|nr:hypothetical protein [Natroniella sulfidigena]MCK8817109.1 hypothetical protein [Natroniella sulfidigena]
MELIRRLNKKITIFFEDYLRIIAMIIFLMQTLIQLLSANINIYLLFSFVVFTCYFFDFTDKFFQRAEKLNKKYDVLIVKDDDGSKLAFDKIKNIIIYFKKIRLKNQTTLNYPEIRFELRKMLHNKMYDKSYCITVKSKDSADLEKIEIILQQCKGEEVYKLVFNEKPYAKL